MYLNIFTPSTDPMKPAPVMVYLHGGNLQTGGINVADEMPDERTAKDMHTVFVNVQYRYDPLQLIRSILFPSFLFILRILYCCINQFVFCRFCDEFVYRCCSRLPNCLIFASQKSRRKLLCLSQHLVYFIDFFVSAVHLWYRH